MTRFGALSPSLLRDHSRGQGLVEYGMIISFVALLAIGGLVMLGPYMGDFFSSMTGSV